jgi:hypothetical protein
MSEGEQQFIFAVHTLAHAPCLGDNPVTDFGLVFSS